MNSFDDYGDDGPVADPFTAADSHGSGMVRTRVMRGQCVVREIGDEMGGLWTPRANERQVKTHRGIVLAIGQPALQGFWVRGRFVQQPVPWGFHVGDIVQYHFVHNKEGFTMRWPEDGELATWIPQACVDGVWG